VKQNITSQDISGLLQQLGLSRHGAAIYLALLEHGEGSVAEIARNSRVLRPLVYRALPSLIERGLIGKVPRGKRTLYAALSPARLEELWEETGKTFREVIPKLAESYTAQAKRPTVIVLRGRSGIISVYEDILATLPRGGIFYRYSSAKEARREGLYVPKDYRTRRDAKQLERYVITSKTSAARKSSRLERAIKTIPPSSDLFAYNITQLIYGTKIAFIDYNTETAVILENPIIAKFQERLFKLLYQRL
jgi:sugar-specific transcriptional regulator TrmB